MNDFKKDNFPDGNMYLFLRGIFYLIDNNEKTKKH